MRALLLPNGNLLVPATSDDDSRASSLIEVCREDPRYGTWLASAEPGEDPRETLKKGTVTKAEAAMLSILRHRR
jgi:hypothetical protein